MGQGGATSQQRELFEDYDGFVEKFRPKKTTDDCYTPDEIYEVVAEWVAEKYGVRRSDMVRPFWPGGDYESFDYPDGCCVVDNPPFSILTAIARFYNTNSVPFVLFAPTLSCFGIHEVCHLITGIQIIYDNGAKINTSFITNIDDDVAKSCPELRNSIKDALDKISSANRNPKYGYPECVVTAATLERYAKRGVSFSLSKDECCEIRALDEQRSSGKAIYGGGLLIGKNALEKKLEADSIEAQRKSVCYDKIWGLSDRERAIVAMLGGDD